MRNRNQTTDNDEGYWNNRLKREMIRYFEAAEAGDVETKRIVTLEILALFEEDHSYEIDGVNRFANNELGQIAYGVRDILTGGWRPTYAGTQEEWNAELSEALEQGDLIQTIKLIKIGKKIAFIRNPEETHGEYYKKVKQLVHNITRNVEKAGR